MTTYNRSLRFAQVDKENIHLLGTSVLFLAHLFGIGIIIQSITFIYWTLSNYLSRLVARVIALSVFASVYGWLIWAICLGHWILMAIWLWLQKTAACSTRTEEFFFCLILAIIHVFTFFNVKPDRTRFRYAFYYTVSYPLKMFWKQLVWLLTKMTNSELPWQNFRFASLRTQPSWYFGG